MLLNGNQTMVLMTKFLLDQWKKDGKINGNQFVGSTIVSTPMLPKLTAAYNVDCKIGLTGFKWIAKMIEEYSNMDFIGGGEESFGFMVGDFVRDKDAVTSTLLACEIAALTKANGSSFFNALIDLYVSHGFFKERLVSITKKGKTGAQEIQKLMDEARTSPPIEINGSKVMKIDDYQCSSSYDTTTNSTSVINIPKANVLIFTTEDGSRIALRPSGTEPKIKYYISVNKALKTASEFKSTEQELEAKINKILKAMNLE
jgi:phosphomannomutase